MSKIKLSAGGFTVIPEGKHIFKITSVEYKEAFGKLEIRMETEDGSKHTERFSFIKNGGGENEGAVRAFSYFGRVALNDPSIDEIDPEDLIGHYIEAEVEHTTLPKRDDPTKTVTFVKLGDKSPASGFKIEAPAAAPVEKKPAAPLDLDDLLG